MSQVSSVNGTAIFSQSLVDFSLKKGLLEKTRENFEKIIRGYFKKSFYSNEMIQTCDNERDNLGCKDYAFYRDGNIYIPRSSLDGTLPEGSTGDEVKWTLFQELAKWFGGKEKDYLPSCDIADCKEPNSCSSVTGIYLNTYLDWLVGRSSRPDS